jgi:hypothetical protein
MPFEGIACTYCGSGDFQEVKPETYFCNNCDRVFKYVDSTRITVAPSFCDHGNRVEVRCQVCETGMCIQRCDAVAAWATTSRYLGIVQTQGFGYRGDHHGYNVAFDAPFLPVAKLMASLALDCDGLSHACYACVTGAVPSAAERIASGEICQIVRCWSPAAGRCPCCNGAFCKHCSVPQVVSPSEHDASLRGAPEQRAGTAVAISVTAGVTISVRNWQYESEPYHIDRRTWRAPDGTCLPCAAEQATRAAAMALAISRQDYAGRLTETGTGQFKVPGVQVRRKKEFEESQRRHEVGARYATEISARVKELMILGGNCNRAEVPAPDPLTAVNYTVVDERDRVKPAAASKVIWAQPAFWYRVQQ